MKRSKKFERNAEIILIAVIGVLLLLLDSVVEMALQNTNGANSATGTNLNCQCYLTALDAKDHSVRCTCSSPSTLGQYCNILGK